jgi:alpha-glucosidase
MGISKNYLQQRLNIISWLIAASISLLTSTIAKGQNLVTRVNSPDNRTHAELLLDAGGRLFYRLKVDNKLIVANSRLGLRTDGPSPDSLMAVTSVKIKRVNEKFSWPLGEEASVSNGYCEAIVNLKRSGGTWKLILRLYNGSLAFRYQSENFPGRNLRVFDELSEFNLTSSYRIFQYHEESTFHAAGLDSLTGISDLPSTLSSAKLGYVCIGEAENRNYTKCVLVKGREPGGLKLHFYVDTVYRANKIASILSDTELTFRDSLVTPWRTVSFSKTAIGLHNFSQLNIKLVCPIEQKTPTGVKPGKVFRVPINTEGALKGIDFAAKMNFQYILVDAGWYGAEFRTVSDPTVPIPGFDVLRIVKYGKQKGIGIILYVNYVGLRMKLDSILPLYKSWGVSGLKFGFVDGGTRKGLSWLDSAMKKVNDYGMVLNVHDHYKPTGLSRRYPFQLSQEGIRGDENSPDAFHNTVLPFTRFLAGAADFTFCFPNKVNDYAKNVKVTKGQQLALTVIFFDPLQAIFWYGRSEDYQDDKEIEFFRYVPTVWDESKYITGEIGQGITVARRKGEIWYLGTAAGLQPWQSVFRLNFLKKNKRYKATIYEDDGNGGVMIRTKVLHYNERYSVSLAAKSGQAVIISPEL